MLNDIWAHDRDWSAIIQVGFVNHASSAKIGVVDGSHGRRDATNRRVADGLLGILHLSGLVADDCSNVLAVTAGIGDGLIVLHGQVFTFLAFEIVVDIGDGRRNFKDDEDVRAQIEDLLGNVVVDAGNKRNHRDHGGYSDNHAEQR